MHGLGKVRRGVALDVYAFHVRLDKPLGIHTPSTGGPAWYHMNEALKSMMPLAACKVSHHWLGQCWCTILPTWRCGSGDDVPHHLPVLGHE